MVNSCVFCPRAAYVIAGLQTTHVLGTAVTANIWSLQTQREVTALT